MESASETLDSRIEQKTLVGYYEQIFLRFRLFGDTPPETNIAPENRSLEKEIPIGNHHFQGLC